MSAETRPQRLLTSARARPQLLATPAVQAQVHTKIPPVLFKETHHMQAEVLINVKENDEHGQAPAPVKLRCPIGPVSTFKSA